MSGLVSCIDCARATTKGVDSRLAGAGFLLCGSKGAPSPWVMRAALFERQCSEFNQAPDAESRRAWLKKKEGADARKV